MIIRYERQQFNDLCTNAKDTPGGIVSHTGSGLYLIKRIKPEYSGAALVECEPLDGTAAEWETYEQGGDAPKLYLITDRTE